MFTPPEIHEMIDEAVQLQVEEDPGARWSPIRCIEAALYSTILFFVGAVAYSFVEMVNAVYA